MLSDWLFSTLLLRKSSHISITCICNFVSFPFVIRNQGKLNRSATVNADQIKSYPLTSKLIKSKPFTCCLLICSWVNSLCWSICSCVFLGLHAPISTGMTWMVGNTFIMTTAGYLFRTSKLLLVYGVNIIVIKNLGNLLPTSISN